MQANLRDERLKDERLKAARFLIVDDELANVRVLELMLEQWDCHQVRSTTDARQTLDLFREFRPDIILLDLMMPEMDGFQVMEQLQPLIPADDDVPFLVLTADTSGQTKRKALACGAKDFLLKPFDEVELLLRIRNLLEARCFYLQLQSQYQVLEHKVEERTQQLAHSREQLRALAASLETMREEERTQIAREVHDVLGQALTGLKMDVAWLDERLPRGHAEPEVLLRRKTRAILQVIDTTIESVQRIAAQLRPALLDDFGLEAAIEWQVQDWKERTGVRCDFVSSLGETEVPPEQATAVFRILQEALTNVTRHAAASRISVLLEENGGYLVLEVQDNGCGINREAMTGLKSLGVLGMQERARLEGGEVTINGIAGKGTTVIARVPLHQHLSP
jgi:signal transduction histidine kinase